MSRSKRVVGHGGGKGGGGGSSSPFEQPDTLRSHAIAKVLDLCGEGEWEELVGGLAGIYFDGTVLQNPDGTQNFSGVSVAVRYGTQDQTVIPGWSDTENELPVGVESKFATPVVRTITNGNVNECRVTVSVPALYVQNPDGNTFGTRVDYAIDVQESGGGFVEVLVSGISGKTRSKFQRSHRFVLPGNAPWDIRIRRNTLDSTLSTLQNRLFFDSYAEIVTAKLRYPNSVLVGVLIDSAQFSHIPTRGYRWKMKRAQVPVNYDPLTRVYSGAWGGTFKVAWTDNPAWGFYDLVINKRYGLGSFVNAAMVDKWSLYTIAQYCDELVPDGFGGMEPRFRLNAYLQTRGEAYKVLNDLVSAFRGMIYWASGAITATQDAPKDPAHLYTNSNVIDGRFVYSGSSGKARHTVAIVTWNDPDDFYRQKLEYVPDEDAILRYGYVEAQVAAMGCTSRGQAHRLGKWILLTELMEHDTVTFRLGLEGAIARPGQIIEIADAKRAGARMGGRIHSASASAAILDAPVTLAADTVYTLAVLKDDGSVQRGTVTDGAGVHTTLNVTPAWAEVPVVQAIWVLSAPVLQSQLFQVLTVNETEQASFAVLALMHNPNKAAAVEADIKLEPRSITLLNQKPAQPTDLSIFSYVFHAAGADELRLTISWTPVPGATKYSVDYRREDDNWSTLSDLVVNYAEVAGAVPGQYSVRVVAVSALGKASKATEATYTLYADNAAPADVTDLVLQVSISVAQLSWAAHPDNVIRNGGFIEIRHSAAGSPTWDAATPVAEFSGTQNAGLVPLAVGTYFAKARTAGFVYSMNAASVVSNQGDPIVADSSLSSVQQPAFTGAKADVVRIDNVLKLGNATSLDDYPFIDTVSAWDAFGGTIAFGTYTFGDTIDLGTSQRARVIATIGQTAFVSEDLIDSRGEVDAWQSVDGTIVNDAFAQLFIRTTDDDPLGAPVWTPYVQFSSGDYVFRAAQFRLELRALSPDHNVAVNQLEVQVFYGANWHISS